jgi:hypothetical protein
LEQGIKDSKNTRVKIAAVCFIGLELDEPSKANFVP